MVTEVMHNSLPLGGHRAVNRLRLTLPFVIASFLACSPPYAEPDGGTQPTTLDAGDVAPDAAGHESPDAGEAVDAGDAADGGIVDAGPQKPIHVPSVAELELGRPCLRNGYFEPAGDCPSPLECNGPAWGGTRVCTSTCSSDRDCGIGLRGPHVCLRHEATHGRCAERCAGSGALCPRQGFVCAPTESSGACVPDCRTPGQGCPVDMNCSLTTGLCDRVACTTTADCPQGTCLADGLCANGCPDDSCGASSVQTIDSWYSASSGPLADQLTIRVDELVGGKNVPLAGATVFVHGGPSGVTDAGGMVTLGGLPGTPVDVTAWKEGYSALTLAQVATREIWGVVIPFPGPVPSEPPPLPPPAFFEGTVCGIALPAGHPPLAAGEALRALLWKTQPSVQNLPPYAMDSSPFAVAENCGAFRLGTRVFGPMALVAVVGIHSPDRTSFKPLALGVVRDLHAAEGQERRDLRIDVDVPLTASVGITTLRPGLPGDSVVSEFRAFLDFGPDGWFALPQKYSQPSPSVTFEGLPSRDVAELVLFSMATRSDPTAGPTPPGGSATPAWWQTSRSGYWLRHTPIEGVEAVLGPMLSFGRLTSPEESAAFDRSIAWDDSDGWSPAIEELALEETIGFETTTHWYGFIDGSHRRFRVPDEVPIVSRRGTFTLSAGGWRWSTASSSSFEYTQPAGARRSAFRQDVARVYLPSP